MNLIIEIINGSVIVRSKDIGLILTIIDRDINETYLYPKEIFINNYTLMNCGEA